MVNILNYGEHNFPQSINSGTVYGTRVSILGIVQSLFSLGVRDCPASSGPVSQRRLLTRTAQQRTEDCAVKTH